MSEILFRGKRVDNGEWITGNVIIDGVSGQCFIHVAGNSVNETDTIGEDGYLRFVAFEVIPETIGQYTGITDKNNVKIFEGDIVEYNDYKEFDIYAIVKFGEYLQDGTDGEYDGTKCIGWYFEVDNFTCADGYEPCDFMAHTNTTSPLEINFEIEVIGNIHDNAELLK